MASINERFLDFQVAQQVRWIRLQNREVREALRTLRSVEKDLRRILQNAEIGEGRFTEARLNALRIQVGNLIKSLETRLTPILTTNVREALAAAAEVEEAAFIRMLPAGLDVTTPNPGVLQTIALSSPFNGATTTEWAAAFHRTLNETVWHEIVDGITSGTTNDDLVRQLLGTSSQKFKDGALQPRRRGLEALVRTSINHATNQGRQAVWAANSDLLKGVMWVATLDTRTTPVCRERDGKVGPIVDDANWRPPSGRARLEPPFARPPAHINCRSTTVAITKSWKELGFNMEELPEGTRASMDGQVPASMTYSEWMKKQKPAVQQEVLGPVRYKMFREGLPLERFTNDQGQLLTIAQIKRLPQAALGSGNTIPAKVALNEYSSVLYTQINTKLRTGRRYIDTDVDWDPNYVTDVARAVDRSMLSASLGKTTQVVRYAGRNWFPSNRELRRGAVFTDRGFVSTSTSVESASIFDFGDAWRFNITIPEGMRAKDLSSLSTFAENEILIDRGTTFRVRHLNRSTRTVYLDIIGQERGPLPAEF